MATVAVEECMRLGLLALLTACGTADDTDTTDMDMNMACMAPMFAPDLSVQVGNYDVSFASTDPAMPDVGVNTWTLDIQDMNDEAASGLSVSVEPWMPEHGHGISPATYSGTEVAGKYELETFDLSMPGDWEFRITVNDGEGPSTSSVTLCIEG